MSRRDRPRLILSAYQCGPGMGSVSQIGWEWFRRLARQLPVTLLTHVRNRESLENARPLEGDPEICYIDTEWFAGPLYRAASKVFPNSQHSVFLISSLDYFAFDRASFRQIKGRMRQGERWDLIHSVTPVSPVAAGSLHRLGLPFVWGPLNGGLGTPKGFDAILKADSPWLYPIRNFGRLADLFWGTTRGASVILSATKPTLEGIPSRYREHCVQMIENGVDMELFKATDWPAPPSQEEALKLVFVGRLVPFKGIPLLLDALVRLKTGCQVKVRIIGDGPMRKPWEEETRRRGLDSYVEFLGALPLDEVNRHLAWSHAFVLPSVRESGGAVLLESMAAKRPVIALDFGGPGEVVDESVGRLVALEGGPPAVAAGLAEAMMDVFRFPEAWKRRAEQGLERARTLYSWDAKVADAVKIYEGLVQ